jgi:tetratricopeptide (TPR) repeat protein
MRRLLLLAALAPLPAVAEIRSAEGCAAAVAADPAMAREEAALWARTGGGVAARLCEADALAALGAHGSAALLLTRVAESPNRAMPAPLRAVVFEDAAGQWLTAGRSDLAAEALDRADGITEPDARRLLLRARAAAAETDWPAAKAALDRAVAADPQDPLAHALLAAALRRLGDTEAAGAAADTALRLAPDLPEALFEAGAAAAETGDAAGARRLWLRLIAVDPDGGLADAARAGLQRLD